MYAMWGISLMPTIIHNHFAKCAFGTATSVNANDNEENYEWV